MRASSRTTWPRSGLRHGVWPFAAIEVAAAFVVPVESFRYRSYPRHVIVPPRIAGQRALIAYKLSIVRRCGAGRVSPAGACLHVVRRAQLPLYGYDEVWIGPADLLCP